MGSADSDSAEAAFRQFATAKDADVRSQLLQLLHSSQPVTHHFAEEPLSVVQDNISAFLRDSAGCILKQRMGSLLSDIVRQVSDNAESQVWKRLIAGAKHPWHDKPDTHVIGFRDFRA